MALAPGSSLVDPTDEGNPVVYLRGEIPEVLLPEAGLHDY